MNPKALQIRLRDFMATSDGWGHSQGLKLFEQLLTVVEANLQFDIFRISLKDVARIDASFPRESIMKLAKRYRGNKGFCLLDLPDEDFLDNLDAGAIKLDQPLFIWSGELHQMIGPPLTPGNQELLDLILREGAVKASDVVKVLDLKLTNASTKLKYLCEKGYILRREEASASGGVEFIYYQIK